MPAKIDCVGHRYGRLVVMKETPSLPRKRRKVICGCDCGAEIIVDPRDLFKGHTTSCGCYHKERVAITTPKFHTTHGMKGTSEYSTWQHMKKRCYDKNCPKYKDYGGRGIIICHRWLDFSCFLQDMGKKPSRKHSIERIDVNGHYEPENCRWATNEEQALNKRNHIMVQVGEDKMPLSKACRIMNINYRSALWRIKKGKDWLNREALTKAEAIARSASGAQENPPAHEKP